MVVDMQAQEGWGTLPFIADGASGLSKRLLLLAPNFLCIHHRPHPGEVPLKGSWKLGQQAPGMGHHLPSLQWGSGPQRCPPLFPRNAPKMHISPKSYCLSPCPGKPPQELWGAGTHQHSSHYISGDVIPCGFNMLKSWMKPRILIASVNTLMMVDMVKSGYILSKIMIISCSPFLEGQVAAPGWLYMHSNYSLGVHRETPSLKYSSSLSSMTLYRY